jgi:outer membrane protein insertion porin family
VDVVPADVSRYVLAPSAARGQSQMESSAEGLDGVFSELSPTDWFGTQSQTSGYTPHVDSFDPPARPQSQNVRDVRQGHSLAPPFDEGRSQVRALPVTGRARVRQAAHEELSFESGRSQLAGHSTSPLAATSRVAWAAEEEDPAASNAGFGFRGIPPEPIYRIDPEAIFSLAPEDITIRAQSPDDIVRAQSIDRNGNPIPQNYMGAVSPQGDPFGDSFNRPGEPAFVDVNIDVTEGRTGRLMFGVGVNSDAGVIGQFTLQEDNFDILRPPRSWADIINGQAWRGRGQSFRIEAMPGSQVSRFLVSWQDPFFLRSDYSFGVSGFFYNRFYNDWTEDRLGGRINVGRLLTRYWSVSAALRLENVDIHDFRTPAPQDLQDVAGDNFLSTGSVTVSHDSRDSAFLPTMGHLLEATYEQGFGEFNYPRVEGSASQYFTIWERPDGLGKHILSLRSQLGWSGDGTPIFERFYAGGYSSFRGFAFRGVTPHEAGITVGGQWMSLGTVEYMAPVTADDNIRVVGFSDFGTVDQDVSMDNFRLSLGFGVRMIIPAMGPAPIALDFAWPLLDEKTDDRRVFSFYVGFTR